QKNGPLAGEAASHQARANSKLSGVWSCNPRPNLSLLLDQKPVGRVTNRHGGERVAQIPRAAFMSSPAITRIGGGCHVSHNSDLVAGCTDARRCPGRDQRRVATSGQESCGRVDDSSPNAKCTEPIRHRWSSLCLLTACEPNGSALCAHRS